MGLTKNVKPTYRIVANGDDITAIIAERLIELTLTDAVGIESDLLEIELADDQPDNPVQMPATGAELELFLGYDGVTQRMGLFICDEVELSGWPGKMNIRARAATYDKSKGGKTDLQTQKSRSWEKGTRLGDMLKKIASEHGMESVISASVASIPLPHIDQADESDLNLLTRISRKYDAIVKPSGGKLVITKRGEGKTASGEDLPTISLSASDCTAFRLVSQRRENAGMVIATWHITKHSRRIEAKVGEGEPVYRIKQYFPTEEMAIAAAKAELAKRKRNQVTVAVTLPGDATLAAECKLNLLGFRDGINGEWLISRVMHSMTQGGYSCDVEATKENEEVTPDVDLVENEPPEEE